MRAARSWPFAIVLSLAVLSPAPAAAQVDPLPDLAALVRELRYEEALREAQALRADGATPPATRLRAVELQAMAEIGLGSLSSARRSFETLLRLDPEYPLSDRRPSPRVREMYDEAREARPEEPEGGLVVGVAAPVIEGAPAAASARPTGEHAVARVRFTATVEGEEVPVHPVPGGPPWRADITLESRESAAGLLVLVRGYAPSGALSAISPATEVMDDEAQEALPGGLEPTGDGAPPRRRRRASGPRPWLWAVLGAVIVVGTFTVVVIASTSGGGGGDDEGGGG